ncbi:PAS domain-containing protein [Deinococcus yavapaiensis]|uniref:PAS domain-containing protein n=1 Tax=Deinococcus yavapaiensis KR-236 TaxID=694435 RepID=A0A318SG62_9DEIO|nr:PAS domain-containing protein [Deinococcus yavapaiensis]PYE48645.1 PAS domain-containing protein [Deinococcus yavapaiensis KR-236]
MISAERLADHLPLGFIAIDHAWAVTRVNAPARLLFRNQSLNPGESLRALIPDEPGSRAWNELERAMSRRVAVEFEVFHPSIFAWHEVSAVPDEQGGLALLLRDVTDRQWVLQKDAEHAYLRGLFKEAPIAISITRGPKHTFEFSNDFARDLVGGRDLDGKTVRAAFPELEGQGYFELLDQVYHSGEAARGEEMPAAITDPETGETRPLVVNFSYLPLRGFDGKVSGILTLTIDVTRYVTRT